MRRFLIKLISIIFLKILKVNKWFFFNIALDYLNTTEKKFFTLTIRPKVVENYKSIISSETDQTAIVIQGPIMYENDFTLNTVKLYKNIFPNSKIILSTWDDEKVDIFKNICHVVKSIKPPNYGRKNVNLQIISTINGIKLASNLGCNYVLKTRCDQRIHSKNLLPYFFKLLSPNYDKLIISSFNTFKLRYISVSDMFMFGSTKELSLYWNTELDNNNGFETYDPITKEFCFMPEYFLAKRYLMLKGFSKCDSKDNRINGMFDSFIIVDHRILDVYWPKYSKIENRWSNYDDSSNIYEYTQIDFELEMSNRE
jgi:hypothetical protein